MSKTLTVSYDLNPPTGAVAPDSYPASKEHKIDVPAGSSQEEYYKVLRHTVLEAKAQIGADLTVWRDAVGNLENAKEPKRARKDDDEEDEEESEE